MKPEQYIIMTTKGCDKFRDGSCIRNCCNTRSEKAYRAGREEEQKRMTNALRELNKNGWTLSDVIEAENTAG